MPIARPGQSYHGHHSSSAIYTSKRCVSGALGLYGIKSRYVACIRRPRLRLSVWEMTDRSGGGTDETG